ncbi:hypothetical protein ABPG72_015928 [Tetrahymena utriculariae]
MKSKIISAGTTKINCQNTGGVCNDEGCGKSGAVANNWQASGTQCVVKDCSQLTANGALISNNICASCNTYSANVFPNSNASACVDKSSAKLLIASAAVIVALLF